MDRAIVKSVLKGCGLTHTLTRALGRGKEEPTTDSLSDTTTDSLDPSPSRGFSHSSAVTDPSARGDTVLGSELGREEERSTDIRTTHISIARPESVYSRCSEASTLCDMNPHTLNRP